MSEEKVRENYLHKIRGAEINRTSSNDLSPLHIVMRKSDKEEIEAGTSIRSAAAASSRAANLDYIKTSIEILMNMKVEEQDEMENPELFTNTSNSLRQLKSPPKNRHERSAPR